MGEEAGAEPGGEEQRADWGRGRGWGWGRGRELRAGGGAGTGRHGGRAGMWIQRSPESAAHFL